MFKQCLNMEQMEIVRDVAKWGNSAGVLLPKEWLGNQVKVVLIERTLDIKKEVFEILSPYLDDILGIYLVGSYARGEQAKRSDIDIIAISKSTKKDIISGKYNISIITLEGAKRVIKYNPILILPRLNEAKAILNSYLLEELKKTEIKKSSFREFIEGTKRMININKGFIDIDKNKEFEYVSSDNVTYSLILRLRGLFLAKCLLKKKKYLKKEFLKLLEKELGKAELEKAYEVYEAVRDDRKIKEKIKIELAEKILNLLKKEVKRW